MPSRLITIESHPILKGLAEYLITEQDAVQGEVDLESTLVVLPTKRARRLFEHFLLDAAEQQGVLVVPPEISTPGRMIDRFVLPTGCPASKVALELIDRQVWLGLAPSERESVEGDKITENGREALLRRIGQLHADACEAQLDFSSILKNIPEGVAGGEERGRWEVLVKWQKARSQKLVELGLQCPYAHRVQSVLEGNVSCGPYQRVILIDGESTPLRVAFLEALDQLGISIERVVPEGDLPGEVDPLRGACMAAWSDPKMGLSDTHIHVADGPQDVGSLLAGIVQASGVQRTSDITIVCPDASLEASLQSVLPELGVPARVSNAGLLLDGALGRLLHAILGILGGGWSEVESALRLPGFASFVQVEERVLEEVDQSRRLCVGIHLDDEKMGGRVDTPRSVSDLRSRIFQILQPLRDASGAVAADAVAELTCQLLDQNLPERARGENKEVAASIQRCLEDFRSAPPHLIQEVDAATLLRMMLRSLSSESLTPDPEDSDVEIVGWMESAFDPAPLRIVVGMNESMIPQMPAPEPLLPDSLKDECGLAGQRSRTARDAWLLWLLEASRSSSSEVHYVVARESPQGDRLLPSRLLLPDLPETVERLPRLLCGELVDSMRVASDPPSAKDEPQNMDFPMVPVALPEVNRVSVTEFRVWLDSPLRFILKKLRLDQTVTPWRAELDAMAFGNLIHGALECWGLEEISTGPTTCATQIYAGFESHLQAYANEMFGKKRPPALQLQIHIAQSRLKALSVHQQELALQGWHVEQVELHFTDRPSTESDVRPTIAPLIRNVAPEILVTGKIDRVDRHRDGQRRAFDYKTGNDGTKTAEKTHRIVSKEGEIQWLDLQLPLYRQRLLEDGTGDVEVGFILLPQHLKKTKVDLLQWGAADYDSANDCADDILQRLGQLDSIPLCASELEDQGSYDRDRFGVLWGEGLRGLEFEDEELG